MVLRLRRNQVGFLGTGGAVSGIRHTPNEPHKSVERTTHRFSLDRFRGSFTLIHYPKTKGFLSMKQLLLAALVLFTPSAFADTYKVSTSDSKLAWVGKKIAGQHNGHLKLKDGVLRFDKGTLAGGEFEVDMSSIVVEDLKDASMNARLTNHLKSDDFFSVAKHPVAKLLITKVEKAKDGKHNVFGKLTIKGITKDVSFPAEIKTEGKKVTAVAKLVLDRTNWDIKFRSGKFFPDIGDKLIHDDFTIDVSLVGTTSK